GAGKSICFQLPALCHKPDKSGRKGLTVVVSPLLSLMKDQVESLRKKSVAAAALTTNTEYEEARKIMRDMQTGELRLLYVSPER
ncbi:hypothetical protein BDK51DRAFT_4931, partial [Blyttiomyces helicus]